MDYLLAMMAKHQKSENDRQHHNQRIAKGIVSIILDNKKNGKVGEELRKHLTKGSKLSVISGLFSIYGFESLKKELGRINDLRLILSRAPVKNNDSSEVLFQCLTGDRFELRFRNQLNQTKVAGECARWLADKAQIQTANNPAAISQNLFHVQSGSEHTIAIQGSSQFTSSGLGYAESHRLHIRRSEPSGLRLSDQLRYSLEPGAYYPAIWPD